MRHSVLALVIAATILPVGARGHEFWISPQNYQIEPGDSIVADLRVGQEFVGPSYAYIETSIERFDLITSDGSITQVDGILGDRPALNMTAPDDGLVIVVHETIDGTLRYSEWQKFLNFVEHKAFDHAVETHAARGWPQTGFSEYYRRFAKSLVAVGDGAGQDRAVGLKTEIVALANPYTDDLSGGLPVQVLLDGQARVNAQVEIFDMAPDESVLVTTVRTDEKGQARVPVARGHRYLLDAVVLHETGAASPQDGPVWKSLWAALTFAVPD